MAWQFVPGDILTAANLNAVTIPWNAVCSSQHSTTQSVTNNTATESLFDTDDLDPLGWHSTSVNTGRVIPTIAGWYQVVGGVTFGSDNDYTRITLRVTKNGTPGGPDYGSQSFVPGQVSLGPVLNCASVPISLNGSTDYVGLSVLQVNTSAAANTAQCRIFVKLLYPT